MGYAYCAAAEALVAGGDIEAATTCFAAAAEAAPRLLEPRVRPVLRRWMVQALEGLTAEIDEAAAGGPSCHAALVVWGEAYARQFVTYCLPSLLAPGNLPCLCAAERLLVTIYCDAPARALIEADPGYRRLQAIADTMTIDIPADLITSLSDDRWQGPARYRNALLLLTQNHHIALWLAARKGASLLYLVPDWIISDGCLTETLAAVEAGAAHVCFPVPVVHQEHMQSAVEAFTTGDGSIDVPAPELARLAVAHLHPSWRQFEAQPDGRFKSGQFPGHMLWRFGESGLVYHSHFRTSVYLTAASLRDYRGEWFWTIDHRLLDTLLESEAAWPTVTSVRDTARALIVAVNPGDHTDSWAGDASDWGVTRIAQAAREDRDSADMTRTNHLFAREPIVFNGAPDPAGLAHALGDARTRIGAIVEAIGDVGFRRL